MASATLPIKQGATLQLVLAVTNDDGTATDLSTVSYSASVRNRYGHLIDSLSLSTSATAGQLTVAQDTSAWPVGTLTCDVRFASNVNDTIVLSDSFCIVVLAAVTRA